MCRCAARAEATGLRTATPTTREKLCQRFLCDFKFNTGRTFLANTFNQHDAQ